MKGGKKQTPYWKYNCEHCLRCFNYCPNHSVSASHSWALLLWYIAVVVGFGGALYTGIQNHIPQLESSRNWFTVELLNAVFYYPAFVIAYFLIYHLTRLRPINSFFSLLSFDRFFGQYREPETRLKDMMKRE